MKPASSSYLGLFPALIQKNKLDLNLDSLKEFCYQMRQKDEKGVRTQCAPGINSSLGGWQSDNVFDETHEEFIKLKKEIVRCANEYHRELEFKKTFHQEIGNIWININQKGQSNGYHDHPFSLFSGAFYFNVETPIVFRHPYADISLYYWNEDVIEKWNPANSGTWFFTPEPNFLIIFPAWLQHKVVINTEDSDRISISFNLQRDDKWKDHRIEYIMHERKKI